MVDEANGEIGRDLVCWFGHHDLWDMAEAVGSKVADLVYTDPQVGRSRAHPDRGSPVKTLIENISFRQVHLLSNYSHEINAAYCDWLGGSAQVHIVSLHKPDNYAEVFEVTDRVLAGVYDECKKAGTKLCIHLGPGTKAMVAVLVLLGCSKYPAIFYQTHKQSAWEESLPFELALFLQEQFRGADRAWADLSYRSPTEVEGFEAIVGESKAICTAVELARRAAIRSINVLLLGESGVGKELFARAIHNVSERKGKFIPVNCAAIPRELLEAELFGSRSGAGSGTAERSGYFAEANNGTLFLDEVGELASEHQAKLLRAIQSADDSDCPTKLQIERVGEPGKARPVDVRVVTATNRDLLTREGPHPFRSDLYYRIATFPITIPPLRERRADIHLIAQRLMDRLNRQFSSTEPGYKARSVAASAMKRLQQYDWPGNVRELNAVLTRAAIMANGFAIERADIDRAIPGITGQAKLDVFAREREPGFTLSGRLERIEKALIEDALDEAGGVQRKAADLLGDNPQTLNKRIHRLGLAGCARRERE